MDELQAIKTLGFVLPTPAYLAGVLLFGLAGLAAFRYGRRRSNSTVKWLGCALMLYPYVVSETWLMYLVGAALCAAIYWYAR